MDNEKCSKEHITCAFYNTKNSMHCASCRHRVLFLSEQLLAEQAKNKKLVEALELALSDTCYDAKTCGYKCQFAILNQCDLFKAGQALNEVNK